MASESFGWSKNLHSHRYCHIRCYQGRLHSKTAGAGLAEGLDSCVCSDLTIAYSITCVEGQKGFPLPRHERADMSLLNKGYPGHCQTCAVRQIRDHAIGGHRTHPCASTHFICWSGVGYHLWCHDSENTNYGQSDMAAKH